MNSMKTETLVLGGGPGGYTAAFRAADLGQKVVIVDERTTLGGVCLNEGCIPSKAYLHVAQVIHEGSQAGSLGVDFGPPKLDLDKIRAHKESVVSGLTKGLAQIAQRRGVTIVRGRGQFSGPHSLTVEGEESWEISFDQAIIASGSRVVRLPLFPFEDERVMDSTDALELPEVPGKLLIVGGGIIGMEMATVYSSLGSEVSVVELTDQIIPPADRDLVKPLLRMYKKRLEKIMVSTKVTAVEALPEGIRVSFEGKKAPEPQIYDRILVGVGRRPNTDDIGLDKLGVETGDRGFIPVDEKRRTSREHIYAIGDVTGQPMLAHKAVHEGKVAAEAISGLPAAFDPLCIPSVAYTDPEIAWTGLTEKQAKAEGIDYEAAVFPWAASGRSLSLGRNEGRTKVLFDRETKKLLGAGIVGTNGGELLGEAVLAVEMGADLADLSLTIHAHPTLSETLGLAAEVGEGTITDL
ncbi:MAG: dihydrolipoyl dehydrogenase [Spirochaetales bacterium]|nr:dihydrolipoyl dehydrogenase [Spirochaetales bacterium]